MQFSVFSTLLAGALGVAAFPAAGDAPAALPAADDVPAAVHFTDVSLPPVNGTRLSSDLEDRTTWWFELSYQSDYNRCYIIVDACTCNG